MKFQSLDKALTFSNFVYDVKNLSQLRNSFVKGLNVHLHIPWGKTQQ